LANNTLHFIGYKMVSKKFFDIMAHVG